MAYILLILLAIALMGMLGGSVAITLTTRRPDQARAGGTCGRCGYSVRGISSTSCPECGADLREVGIVHPVRASTVRFVTAGVLWLLPVTLLGVLVMAMGSVTKAFASSAAVTRRGELTMLVALLATLAIGAAGPLFIRRWMGTSARVLAGLLGGWVVLIVLVALAVGVGR